MASNSSGSDWIFSHQRQQHMQQQQQQQQQQQRFVGGDGIGLLGEHSQASLQHQQQDVMVERRNGQQQQHGDNDYRFQTQQQQQQQQQRDTGRRRRPTTLIELDSDGGGGNGGGNDGDDDDDTEEQFIALSPAGDETIDVDAVASKASAAAFTGGREKFQRQLEGLVETKSNIARLNLGPVIRLPPLPDVNRPQQRSFFAAANRNRGNFNSIGGAAADGDVSSAFAAADAAWLAQSLASDPMMAHVTQVEGLFPFKEAYPLQIEYMSSVIRCLATGGASALLESPTGTGKTICLLVACAAWLGTLESPHVRAKLKTLLDNRERALRGRFSMFVQKQEKSEAHDWLAEQYADSLHRCVVLRRALDKPPRVFYASRTHSQLQQVVRELKSKLRLCYPHVRSSILGSRSQMCVNPDVMPSAAHNVPANQVNQLCRVAVLTKKCAYHLGGTGPSVGAVSERVAAAVPEVWDIEDVQNLGKKLQFCPFFYSRDLAKLPTAYTSEFGPTSTSASSSRSSGDQKPRQQDTSQPVSQPRSPHIVFLPYNYLCDRRIRTNMKIDTKNEILIFDEAHNVDGVCCDSASFELTVRDLQDALRDARACDRALVAGMRAARDEQEAEAPVALTPTFVQKVMQIIDALQKALAARVPPPSFRHNGEALPHSIESLTFNAEWLLRMLKDECNVTAGTYRTVVSLMQQMIDLLSENTDAQEAEQGQGPARNVQDSGLQKFMDFLLCVYEVPLQNFALSKTTVTNDEYVRQVLDDNFCVYLGPDDSQSSAPKRMSFIVPPPNQFKLCFWCMSPGLCLRDIISARTSQSFAALLGEETTEQNQGVVTFDHMYAHALIMTSGTLNPLNEFSADFGWRFEVQLENPHVIDPAKQVLVAALSVGPGKERLNSSFKNRDSRGYVLDLGNSIVNLCRIVPHGVLCFFASYGQLRSCLEMWDQPQPELSGKAIMQRLKTLKEVVIEPQRSDALPEALRAFVEAVRRAPASAERDVPTGAIFFAVLRGKVAEGLDFADEIGRAVIITGIPYPMKTDPKVVLHRRFNDVQRTRFQSAAASGSQLVRNRPPPVGGNQWYETQASRAVNQAIGRVIRHRHDYGAILFADERFANKMQASAGRPVSSFLSRWLRPHCKVFPSFGPCQVAFANFFRASRESTVAVRASADGQASDARTFLERIRTLFGVSSTTWTTFERALQVLYAEGAAGVGLDDDTVRDWVRETAMIFATGLVQLPPLASDLEACRRVFDELCAGLMFFCGSSRRELVTSSMLDAWNLCEAQHFAQTNAREPPTVTIESADSSLEWIGSTSATVPKRAGGKAKYDIVTGQRLKTEPSSRPAKKPRPTSSNRADLASEGANRGGNHPLTSDTISVDEFFMPHHDMRASEAPIELADASTVPMHQSLRDQSAEHKITELHDNAGSHNHVLSPMTASASPATSAQKCVVCLSRPMVDPHAARCGHVCCRICWEQALAVKLECPVCRERTRLKQLLRVFV